VIWYQGLKKLSLLALEEALGERGRENAELSDLLYTIL